MRLPSSCKCNLIKKLGFGEISCRIFIRLVQVLFCSQILYFGACYSLFRLVITLSLPCYILELIVGPQDLQLSIRLQMKPLSVVLMRWDRSLRKCLLFLQMVGF